VLCPPRTDFREKNAGHTNAHGSSEPWIRANEDSKGAGRRAVVETQRSKASALAAPVIFLRSCSTSGSRSSRLPSESKKFDLITILASNSSTVRTT